MKNGRDVQKGNSSQTGPLEGAGYSHAGIIAALQAADIPVPDRLVVEKQRRRPALPTREQWVAWAPYLGVLLLGAILRFWGLGDRPLHHDESLHAYFSLQLMHNNYENWLSCVKGLPTVACYRYDPLLHGPFQFHMIALVYQISQWIGAPDHGVNTTTVRFAAASLGTVIVGLPYFLRSYLGRLGSWLACFLLAVSPSMVYFSRFAREDIYMACFTLLMIVAAGCYVRTRKGYWLVLAATGFMFSYATKEATFLSIAIFGSFLLLLLAWEIGVRFPVRVKKRSNLPVARYLPGTGAPIALLALVIILAPLAKWFFGWMKDLSIYVNDPRHTPAANVFVANLKQGTVSIFPWLGILLGLYVLSILLREIFGWLPAKGVRRGLARRLNPEQQPVLDMLLTMPWTHWFFALMAAVIIFLLLFTALFTNVAGGIGDGVWQGLYYWLQQQQIARGGQPWYYYLLLIPFYEQIGLVFGLIGLVRCLLHPSRFRLFLVYWFVGNLFIYSWAGEKMPWLVIHITMPMMLLAALGLELLVLRVRNLVQERSTRTTSGYNSVRATVQRKIQAQRPALVRQRLISVGTAAGLLAALFLLVLTLQNMLQVTYVHAADAPHEMMIYVQTTPDVQTVMDKIDALNQQKFNGNYSMPIGVMADAEWPFYWYLRDYTNVCYNYPSGCATSNPAVILTGGDNLYTSQAQYSNSVNGKPADYTFKQYHLRTWWDEGYKPIPCVQTKSETCAGQPTWGGLGVLPWLSYGDTPPTPGTYDLGKAANNVWLWWWQRKPLGSTAGTTDMGLFMRKNP